MSVNQQGAVGAWPLLTELLRRVTSRLPPGAPAPAWLEKLDTAVLPDEAKALFRAWPAAAQAVEDAASFKVVELIDTGIQQRFRIQPDAATETAFVPIGAEAQIPDPNESLIYVRVEASGEGGRLGPQPTMFRCFMAEEGWRVVEKGVATFDELLAWRWALAAVSCAYEHAGQVAAVRWPEHAPALQEWLDKTLAMEPDAYRRRAGWPQASIGQEAAWLTSSRKPGRHRVVLAGSRERVRHAQVTLREATHTLSPRAQ